MFFKKSKKEPPASRRRMEDQLAPQETVIARETTIKGKLRSPHNMTIDGEIEGEIHSDGIVFLAKNALVKGHIQVGGAIVEGCVQGDITARGNVEVRATGQVSGDIECARIAFEEGCAIQGNIHMPEKDTDPVRFQEKRTPPKPAP